MTEFTCDRCKWWERLHLDGDAMGLCHLMPPRLEVLATDDRTSWATPESWVHPTTIDVDYCSHWEQAREFT